MKKTLQKINELLHLGIIEKYAIAGGMAQFYYIEPSVTYDIDLLVNITGEENTLNPLIKIYEWAESYGYSPFQEHILIEGIPVQFLLTYNDLVKEALDNSVEIVLFDEKTFILRPEYLMAILLQTGRLSDRERFTKFLADADYDNNSFLEIIERFNLSGVYKKILGG